MVCTESTQMQLACAFAEIEFVDNAWSTKDGGIGSYMIGMVGCIFGYFLLLAFIEWESTNRLGLEFLLFFLISWETLISNWPNLRILILKTNQDISATLFDLTRK